MENEAAYTSAKVQAIYPSMGKIMKTVQAIGKDQLNTHYKFMFRGIDDALNSLHTVFADNDVVLRWEILTSDLTERKTKEGTTNFYNELIVDYYFVSTIDGSSIHTRAIGAAADAGDKHFSKALSMALKYVLFHTFLIPTGDIDADAEVQEATINTQKVQSNIATEKQVGYLQSLYSRHKARLTAEQVSKMKATLDTKQKDSVDRAIKFLKELEGE